MRIVISSGHGKYVRGAAGPEKWKSGAPGGGLDEVDEARRIVVIIAELPVLIRK